MLRKKSFSFFNTAKISQRTFSSLAASPLERLEYLRSQTPSNIFSLNRNGDTELHKRCHTANVESIFEFMREIGYVATTVMACIVNNDGKLPSDIIREGSLSIEEKENVNRLLFTLLKEAPHPTLANPIELDQTLEEYASYSDPALKQLLFMGIEIANKVRSKIQLSYTHPQTNLQNLAYQLIDLRDKIIDMRRRRPDELLAESDDFFIPLIPQVDGRIAQENGMGNCYEFACSVDRELKKLGFAYHEIIEIKHGNHIVVAAANNLKDPDNKKPDIFIDAWYGKIILACDLAKKAVALRSLHMGDDVVQIVTSINEKYHAFEPYFPSQTKQAVIEKEETPYLRGPSY